MCVVGVIIPVGYFHINGPDEDATIYPLPIRLSHPYLRFEELPFPEELCDEFDRIVEDVQESYRRRNIVPQPRTDYCMTGFVHVSHLELAFYAGLWPAAEQQVWHRMLRMTEGQRLAHYRFDSQYAHEVAAMTV